MESLSRIFSWIAIGGHKGKKFKPDAFQNIRGSSTEEKKPIRERSRKLDENRKGARVIE